MATKNTKTKTEKTEAPAVQMAEPSIKPIVAALEDLYQTLNVKFFAGELERPVITVSPDTTKGATGWFTPWRSWTGDDDENVKAKTGYLEINLCAEWVQRPLAEMVETLLHEMVHLFCFTHNIRDTSRNGYYHNDKYKEQAEIHGLAVAKDDKHGWAHTSLTEETKEWVDTLSEDAGKAFAIHRRRVPKKDRKVVKSHSIKYECPCCGASVRATKSVSILCMECKEVMRLA